MYISLRIAYILILFLKIDSFHQKKLFKPKNKKMKMCLRFEIFLVLLYDQQLTELY